MNDLLLPLPLILLGWMVAGGSPGPATLAISGSSMEHGRPAGIALALGVVMGSMTWGITAGLGFSALMMTNVWIFEIVKYAGATYLLYLAVKSLRVAWRGHVVAPVQAPRGSFFLKGLTLHLTNPKAVLGWGSIYAIALTPGAGPLSVWLLFVALSAASVTVFVGYAMLFSTSRVVRGYTRAKRWFDLAFGVLFGAASIKLLSARLS